MITCASLKWSEGVMIIKTEDNKLKKSKLNNDHLRFPQVVRWRPLAVGRAYHCFTNLKEKKKNRRQ